MNKIDTIVIHCSSTKEGVDIRAKDIDRWHREKGFQMIGYHYVIDLDGTVETGRPLSMEGAHCKERDKAGVSYNKHSIGICYIGGLGSKGERDYKDTRTEAQKASLKKLVEELKKKYPIKEIIGHRDASPDKNGDGKITPDEYIKACPCFDVKSEFPMGK